MSHAQIETHASHGGPTAIAALVQQALACPEDDPAAANWGLLGAARQPWPPGHQAARTGGLAPWQIKRVRAYIEAHLAERMPLRMLAEQTRLSTSTFSRSFRQSLGHSPMRYVMIRRIEQAQRLMVASDLRLCEVAIACGFADQAHFGRRLTGVTPARWRRRMLGWIHRQGPDHRASQLAAPKSWTDLDGGGERRA